MRKIAYLGALTALFMIALAPLYSVEAQEVTGRIPEPVPGGTTPVEGPREDVKGSIPEPVPGGTTPVSGEQYDEQDKISIPEPVPGGATPVEGPPYEDNGVTRLPDTGGLYSLTLIGGALLLGSGLVVRRIFR